MNSFERKTSTSRQQSAERYLAAFMVWLLMAPVAAFAQEAGSAAEPAFNFPLPASRGEQPAADAATSDQQPATGGQESGIMNQESGQAAEGEQQTPPPETPAEPASSDQQPATSEQTSDASAGATDTTSSAPEIPIATSTPEANQDTANPQTTIGGSDLLATTDPNNATTTDGGLGILDEESGDTAGDGESGVTNQEFGDTPLEPSPSDQHPAADAASSFQQPAASEQPIADSNPPLPDQTPPPHTDVIATLSREALKPKPEYTLGVVGTVIAARAKPRWQAEGANKRKDDEATVSASPAIATDNENGILSVSGSCRLAYFSVILYRHQDDYDRDPASYIVNKAFPCENGSYSYTLTGLPKNLAASTYYLLVAEQGDSGPWHPISAIIPITIAPHP